MSSTSRFIRTHTEVQVTVVFVSCGSEFPRVDSRMADDAMC